MRRHMEVVGVIKRNVASGAKEVPIPTQHDPAISVQMAVPFGMVADGGFLVPGGAKLRDRGGTVLCPRTPRIS